MNSVGATQTYRTRLGTQQPKVDIGTNTLCHRVSESLYAVPRVSSIARRR
jgi:hypothetical protein